VLTVCLNDLRVPLAEKPVDRRKLEKFQESAKSNLMELDIDEIDDDMVSTFTVAVLILIDYVGS